jgi:vancomycin resistance protein YoaR
MSPPFHGRHAPPPRRPRRWGLRIGIVVAFLGALGGAATLAKLRYLPDAIVLPGVSVDGERVPDGANADAVRALVEGCARRLLDRKVALEMPGEDEPVLVATLEDLGIRVDVERTLSLLRRVGKDGDLITRAEAARDARAGKIDVPLFVHADEEAAMQRLHALKEAEDTSPISARLDLDKHETIPEKEGRYIDAHETIAALELLARHGATREREDRAGGPPLAAVMLPVKTFAPRISSAFLKSLDISAVVAEYETYFSRRGEQASRGKNIDNAARKLDGLVLSPGEMVSFNEVIGERSKENGFEKSWEIFKGEMVEGIGGGTCQVASTFHAASFFAGFDILERLPHSRPSAYIPMGLDSTVVYPAVDLKVRNPHPFPVVVHAKTIGNRLRIELLGKMRPVRVAFEREIVETLPYKRKIEEDPTLSGKKVVVKQHGIKGYRIKRTRTLTYPDGTKKKEETTDTYPPTIEIYKVPVGFDVALLPPLPDEGDGEDSELPSRAPPSASTPSRGTDVTASAVGIVPTSETAARDIELVDAPGAHAPTASQRDPEKKLRFFR